MVGGFAILDFGSQLTQLIARRLRELGYYSEIYPYNVAVDKIIRQQPKGIILSGGPSSVYEDGAPDREIHDLAGLAPLLGICYGMQLITKKMGGIVERSENREYGFNTIQWTAEDQLSAIGSSQKVWMSHGDVVKVPPPGFRIAAKSESNHPAAMKSPRIWAVQFHPEVAHTEKGTEFLSYFAKDVCKAEDTWDAPHITEHLKKAILTQVGPTAHVLCGLSGGVDSTVAATLLTQSLGRERVHCVFVDNGLLRKNEYELVLTRYQQLGLNVRGVDAKKEFMSALAGISDPELKRKTIGRVFIEVFEKASQNLPTITFLAQGTLYPDVIESVSPRGASVTIKSHHNVGGLPEKMKMKLVEPLRELFKDEVRAMGKELGLADDLLGRHPFPGPGLAIRIIGEVNEDDLKILRDCDDVYIKALREEGIYDKIWQAFCVLLPIKTVGVQGDGRTYDRVIALRAVTSVDGMTADWYPFEFKFMREISNRITNQVRGVNRVVYDVTSKPPGTIEWE